MSDTFLDITFISEKKLSEAIDFIHSLSTHTFDEVAAFVVGTVWDSRQEELLDMLEAAQAKGIGDPSQVPSLKRLLLASCPDALRAVQMYGKDVATPLGSYLPSNNSHHDSWDLYNPDLITREFTRGRFGQSYGLPGSGKTDFSCSVMERWILQGRMIITNVRMQHPVPGIIFANKMSLLLKGIIKCHDLKVDWLFIDDEAGTSWLRATAMRGTNIDQSKFVRIIRKFHGNFYYIDQLEPTPTVLESFITCKFHCVKPGVVNMAIGLVESPTGPRFAFRRWVQDFPPTKLPFDTDDPASFSIDVDVDEVIRTASDLGVAGVEELLA